MLNLINIPYRWLTRAYQEAEAGDQQHNIEMLLRRGHPQTPDSLVCTPAHLIPESTLLAICEDELERRNRLQVMPANVGMLRCVLDDIRRMAVGQKMTFPRDVLDEIPPMFHNGCCWTPEDRVIENVVGGSYCLSYRRDPHSGDVTFERHADTGRKYYESPDRR